MQHAWRTKRVLLENAAVSQDGTLLLYHEAKQTAILHALQRWREGWPGSLLDFEPTPDNPTLYQDRAEVCWFLAGIIMLPNVTISLPRAAQYTRALSVQQILEKILAFSDQNQLHYSGQDFGAVYQLITRDYLTHGGGNDALGTLFYREPDTTRAGFEE